MDPTFWLKQSGFYRLVGAIDIDRSSLASISVNFGVPALEWDIRDLAGDPQAQTALLSELPDFQADLPLVLIGCAPCQGFSAHRKKNWEEKDHRNSLVNEFCGRSGCSKARLRNHGKCPRTLVRALLGAFPCIFAIGWKKAATQSSRQSTTQPNTGHLRRDSGLSSSQ